MTLFEELKARGLVAQMTDEDETAKLLNEGKATFYMGFDPTADSLHVGHAQALTLMKLLQAAGNRPIALIGGGTTMVGDPSGRTDMRPMLTQDEIAANGERFKAQMRKYIDFGEGKALMVNNADWLLELNYVELLRDVGSHFSVNRMLTAECYKKRMEEGLSFLEFNYMIMQAYDYYKLFETQGCQLQCGGDDQWSNMLAGSELIRRKLGKNVYVMTVPLLLKSDGEKMGKTAGGAVWLDPEKTSPFDFWQYWRNIDDADVGTCLRKMTFLPLEQIAELEQGDPNVAKEALANAITSLVHSPEEADKSAETARSLFGGGVPADMPTVTVSAGMFSVASLLVKGGLCPSTTEARRNIEQGGVSVDGVTVEDVRAMLEVDSNGVILKKGKKSFLRVIASGE